jgi:hydroxyethylthiazole kinase-like uncharacterized protein yjeF
MRPLFRPSEMAAADRLTILAGTPGEVLMERAGRAVARAVLDLAGFRYGLRALVLCGKGNNGGDGFVAARVLAAQGVSVTCLCVFDPQETSGDAATHLARMRASGIEPRRFAAEAGRLDAGHFHVVVDAIFGTGFTGVAAGEPASAIDAVAGHPALVAVDIPSGVDGLTGAVAGPAIFATETVAMGAEKTGTAVPPGSTHAGVVRVADIGIDVGIRKFESAGEGVVVDSFVEMVEASDVAASLPQRSPSAHKRSSGSVVILAGSDEMRGAALLCASGALRMGAGYVTLGSTAAVKHAAAAAIPEVLCRVASDGDALDATALDEMKTVIERGGAVAIGPGMGTSEGARALVRRLVQEVTLPLVVDADAINVLDPADLRTRTHPTVLTPHPAELGRLMNLTTDEVVADRLGAVAAAARAFPSSVVLLKGNRTVISYAGGKAIVVIPVGGPELATAGTGDVLTGALAALLSQGIAPAGAAIAAAYVHGLAGSVAGSHVGPQGVLAGDVALALPEAWSLLVQRPA